MANPTTNYGFVLPTPTDLVTDLPADFDVALQGVDTQMLTNANAAIAKTIVDAKGDIIAATAADAVSRLAVGANDTVLTADSTTATGLKWAAAAAGGKNFSLLNTGGTALTGAATVTVSGISGKDQLLCIIKNATMTNNTADFGIQVNGIATTTYANTTTEADWQAAYNAGNYQTTTTDMLMVKLGRSSGSAAGTVSGSLTIFGTSTSGLKTYIGIGGGRPNGNSGHQINSTSNIINTTAITSVSAYSGGGNWTGGTLFVYGAA